MNERVVGLGSWDGRLRLGMRFDLEKDREDKGGRCNRREGVGKRGY